MAHMWVEFAVGSRRAPRVLFGFPDFNLPPRKPTSPNSNSTRIDDPHGNQLQGKADVASSPCIAISLFIK